MLLYNSRETMRCVLGIALISSFYRVTAAFSLPSQSNASTRVRHLLHERGVSVQAQDDDMATEPTSPSSRRSFVIGLSAFASYTTCSSIPKIAKAADGENEQGQESAVETRTFLKGKISTKSEIEIPDDIDPSKSALYITARPNKADNVPRAILDGSNGKPPPVLSARIADPKFPLEFELSTLDLTQEGVASFQKLENKGKDQNNTFWFEGQDLIISARFDTDGVAATRSPTDLVGRTQYIASKNSDDMQGKVGSFVDLQLEGRGITGKFLTGKAKK